MAMGVAVGVTCGSHWSLGISIGLFWGVGVVVGMAVCGDVGGGLHSLLIISIGVIFCCGCGMGRGAKLWEHGSGAPEMQF